MVNITTQLIITEFSILKVKVQYEDGRKNVVADALSRMPAIEDENKTNNVNNNNQNNSNNIIDNNETTENNNNNNNNNNNHTLTKYNVLLKYKMEIN